MTYFTRIIFICFLIPLLGFAETMPPPDYPFHDRMSWSEQSKTKPVSYLTMGQFKVRFEETTLQKIIEATNNNKIFHQGDADGSIYWLCYTATEERIWIVSHGEMGGLEHVVNFVIARSVKNVQATEECPMLPSRYLPLSLNKTLWLGTPEKTAHTILGLPSHEESPWESFNYQGKVEGECKPEGFDLTNWLFIKFEHGLIIELQAGQVTSC